jgi:hypothetical protein
MTSVRDKSRFRKTYSFLRVQPRLTTIIQAIGHHQYDEASIVDLARFKKIYGSSSPLIPPEFEFLDFERGTFLFNNETEVTHSFTRNFLSVPVVVVYLEDYYSNNQNNTEVFIVDRTLTDVTVGTAAPFRGKVHYLAICLQSIAHRSIFIEDTYITYETGIVPFSNQNSVTYSFIEPFPSAPTVTATSIDLNSNQTTNVEITISDVTSSSATFNTSAQMTGGISFHATL